ncbi:MAG: glutamine synthetase III [Clostridia bacterium]|nr:glutamine synthetase III [Clostridia bacterium]
MLNVPELFGSMVFSDAVMRERLPEDVYHSLTKTIERGKAIDPSIADCVASAMKDWAIEKGATHYTHWFQPLTGVSAEKHDAFITPVGNCKVIMEFSGKELIKGESDASSFPSGGLRATFEARGYTAWDPASYAFVKDGSLYIPTAFCSYTGEALDCKTPLLRSMDAVSEQALRILRLFGDTTAKRVCCTVGAEQEYFLIDKEDYKKRKDLIYSGRTLFGSNAAKGQEMEDHYFGTLKTRVSEFMHELDRELWSLGINAKTKHNEGAPAQHELAPMYSTANLAVDQNVLMMDCMKKIAERHGLVCLLHEKPFKGISGSGKHNNWSLNTDTGKNLMKPGVSPEENAQFMLILAATVRVVDEYADLLRLSVASAGNDHRLGVHEAPPAIVSMFLGDELTAIVESITGGNAYKKAKGGTMYLGAASLPTFERDNTDRNRTSPFAFTGNKFEFRMLGSSQNVALPNVVLNTGMAEVLCEFADKLEGAKDFDAAVKRLIKETLKNHKRVIFNGNGYSEEWEREAERRGLPNMKRSVDAFACFVKEKNVRLFEKFGVMSRSELESRTEILYENYAKTINIESRATLEMARRDFIPAAEKYIALLAVAAKDKLAVSPDFNAEVEKMLIKRLSDLNFAAYELCEKLEVVTNEVKQLPRGEEQAKRYCYEVIPLMDELRDKVDRIEKITDSSVWPVPSYGQMTYYVDR